MFGWTNLLFNPITDIFSYKDLYFPCVMDASFSSFNVQEFLNWLDKQNVCAMPILEGGLSVTVILQALQQEKNCQDPQLHKHPHHYQQVMPHTYSAWLSLLYCFETSASICKNINSSCGFVFSPRFVVQLYL